MLITNEVIESFPQCQYKSFLKCCGKNGEKTDYESLQEDIKDHLFSTFSERIRSKQKTSIIPHSSITPALLDEGFEFILKSQVTFEGVQLHIDFLEKVSNQSHRHKFSYIPTWIFPNEHVTKTERLIVTCFGILLQDIHEIEPEFGKILYGRRLQTFTVKYANLTEEAQNILEQIRSNSTPALSLNKHCSVCEFSISCREEAVQSDHLSLLGRITPKEIERFNNKGIFTVKQLSYTFRPRRNRTLRNPHTKLHSFELQALAIREQKIYVYELPALPTPSVEIYVDIEGLPDRNFQYLIGVVIHEGSQTREYHFWADEKDEENTAFQEFLTLLSQYPEYTLFHYGSYEPRAFKNMSNSLPDDMKQHVEKLLHSCCNILSFLYSTIYFPTYTYVKLRRNFGHNVKSWSIFQHIVNRESFAQIEFNLSELFGIHLTPTAIQHFKKYISEYYEITYERLLEKILTSKVIYVDETLFSMRYETAYAWVFTNGKEVISIYKSTRAGDFLKDLLKDFNGVLVSDFFQVYDTMNCPQQKCLIHLLRDFNDDLIKHPFEEDFKEMTRLFTILLQNIVKTIDEYGLQKKHLKKHKREVKEFFTHVFTKKYTSEIARKYQQRLEKNRNTLFTFLDYNKISWNNTYAEHAIKLLATHRNRNIQFFRASRLDDYLKIMSLYQTCKYKEVSFLKFLRSQDTDIDKYCRKNLS